MSRIRCFFTITCTLAAAANLGGCDALRSLPPGVWSTPADPPPVPVCKPPPTAHAPGRDCSSSSVDETT